MKKIYFWDNGIRNAILGSFDAIQNRTDVGMLWENFMVSERLKRNINHGIAVSSFFWRSKQQQEIDYVETNKEQVEGYECKFNPLQKHKPTKAFTNMYPQATSQVIHSENYHSFIGLS